jgi:hypothetical protein
VRGGFFPAADGRGHGVARKWADEKLERLKEVGQPIHGGENETVRRAESSANVSKRHGKADWPDWTGDDDERR